MAAAAERPVRPRQRRRLRLRGAAAMLAAAAATAAAAAAAAGATVAALRPLHAPTTGCPLAGNSPPMLQRLPASGGVRVARPARGAAAAKRLRRPKPAAGKGFSMRKVDDKPPADYDSGARRLAVLQYPHPLLREANAEVAEFGEKLRQLAENLFGAMYAETDPPGIGLAAPQVGVNLRVMVYNSLRTPEADNREGEVVFVNPKITAFGDDRDEVFESCLSFPKMEGPVIRPMWIVVEAVDIEGKPFKRRIEGDEARVFQHEYDHLDGVLYIDRMEEEDMPMVRKRLDKLISDYKAGGGKQPAL